MSRAQTLVPPDHGALADRIVADLARYLMLADRAHEALRALDVATEKGTRRDAERLIDLWWRAVYRTGRASHGR